MPTQLGKASPEEPYVRKARLVQVGDPHLIEMKAVAGKRLFSFPSDYKQYLWNLQEVAKQGHGDLHGWVLLPERVRLVVTPHNVRGLAQFVKTHAQAYVWYWNRKRGSSGRLFTDRFVSAPLHEPLHTWTAQEMLPVEEGLVRTPTDYLWSSARHHWQRGGRYAPMDTTWKPLKGYQTLGPTPWARGKAYAALCRELHPTLSITR